VHSKPDATHELRVARMRAADEWTGRLHHAGTFGIVAGHLGPQHTLDLVGVPVVQQLLDEAPRVASLGGPTRVRMTRTPRGALSVVRLHGDDWSLVMTAARPVPAVIFAFADALPDPYAVVDEPPGPFNIRDPNWLPELATMADAVLAAVDVRWRSSEAAGSPSHPWSGPRPDPGPRTAGPGPTLPPHRRR
jgi:hypothetical protein